MKQVKYLLFALLLAFTATFFNSPLCAAPDPDRPTPPPQWVQARVFKNLNLQDFKLDGVLHTKKKIYPMEMLTRNKEIIYRFKDQPLQIRVLLDPAAATVERRKNDNEPWQPVTGRALEQRIFDTDIAYEDIGLSFIFWDNITSLGSDSIKTLPAWAFEARPPEGAPSLYAKVRYWISSDYFAFLRVDAYNAQDQIIKRVEVNGVKKIGAAYVIEEMEIATMIPGRDLSASRTYIEVRSGTPGSGLQ